MTEGLGTRISKDLALAAAVGLSMFLALFGWPVANMLFGPIGWVWLVLALVLVASLLLGSMLVDSRHRSAPV